MPSSLATDFSFGRMLGHAGHGLRFRCIVCLRCIPQVEFIEHVPLAVLRVEIPVVTVHLPVNMRDWRIFQGHDSDLFSRGLLREHGRESFEARTLHRGGMHAMGTWQHHES